MKSLVSVILPSFNSCEYIAKTIESVLDQSYKNFELIIIDDASNDSSVRIIKSYKNVDERVKLIELRENKGQAFARNKGIEVANGDYITFIDSDDIWVNIFLEEQLNFMKSANAQVVFSSYQRMDEKLEKNLGVFKVPSKTTYKALLKSNYMSCLTTVIDIRSLGKFYFRDKLKMHEDFVLWLEVLKKAKVAYGNPSVLAIYRIRNKSVSRNKFKGIIRIWDIYLNIEKLNVAYSIYNLILYIFKGFLKNYRFLFKS